MELAPRRTRTPRGRRAPARPTCGPAGRHRRSATSASTAAHWSSRSTASSRPTSARNTAPPPTSPSATVPRGCHSQSAPGRRPRCVTAWPLTRRRENQLVALVAEGSDPATYEAAFAAGAELSARERPLPTSAATGGDVTCHSPAWNSGHVTRYGCSGNNSAHSAWVRLRPATLQANASHVSGGGPTRGSGRCLRRSSRDQERGTTPGHGGSPRTARCCGARATSRCPTA